MVKVKEEAAKLRVVRRYNTIYLMQCQFLSFLSYALLLLYGLIIHALVLGVIHSEMVISKELGKGI